VGRRQVPQEDGWGHSAKVSAGGRRGCHLDVIDPGAAQRSLEMHALDQYVGCSSVAQTPPVHRRCSAIGLNCSYSRCGPCRITRVAFCYMRYLSKRRQTWFTRVAVPRRLRSTLGRADSVRTFGTRGLALAMCRRDRWMAVPERCMFCSGLYESATRNERDGAGCMAAQQALPQS
jgi:hypothetical protein